MNEILNIKKKKFLKILNYHKYEKVKKQYLTTYIIIDTSYYIII